MKDREQELMEVELQRLKPAMPPSELIERMLAGVPVPCSPRLETRTGAPRSTEWWMPWLRWLAPVSAIGLVTFVSIRQIPLALNHPVTGINADAVQISHKLVSAYDAVGELPGGEAVRFRVREWSDSTVMHDSARGLVVEQSKPRLEIIPVAFETY
jgi:hypothetical protein